MRGHSNRTLGLLFVPLVAVAAYAEYTSAQRKLDLIESDGLARGARVELTRAELNAWAEQQVTQIAGVRNPNLQLGAGTATGSALVDFGKLRQSRGQQSGWLMAKLLEGERPVSVVAHIRSQGGTATVDVESVTVSGITLDGATLDFAIQHFLLPLYPDAAVGRPFQLGHRIDRLEIRPAAVTVVIGR